MGFPRDEVSKLLAACHRRCCICHRFCGVKIETDHIVPGHEGGPDDIDNAIPVCFECYLSETVSRQIDEAESTSILPPR